MFSYHSHLRTCSDEAKRLRWRCGRRGNPCQRAPLADTRRIRGPHAKQIQCVRVQACTARCQTSLLDRPSKGCPGT